MRTRLLAAALLLTALAPAAHAAEAPGEHLVVRVNGVLPDGGCGPICAAAGAAAFTGTITTVENGSVVTLPFTSDFTWTEACDGAYGTLYFGDNVWPFSWSLTGPAFVMFANDQGAANFVGPGVFIVPPQPVASDAAGACLSGVLVEAMLARGPRPGPVA